MNGYLNLDRSWNENYQIYDCWDQTRYVNEKLDKLKITLDDQWDFTVVDGFGHATGRASSGNPKDPTIDYDPWRNKIEPIKNN